jgi:putative acetyltransferase
MDTPPPPDLLIRAARPQDAEAIADLQNLSGFRYNTLRLPYNRPEEIRRSLETAQEDNRILVVLSDGHLVASGDLRRFAGRRAHVGTLGMGVHDAWRGRGIGRALLGEIVGIAERWLGLRRLELTVYVDNAPAIALYRRFGFAVEGTHRGYALRDGALVDAYTMARIAG